MFCRDKNSNETERAELVPVPAPVTEALILICEKCGKKLSGGDDNNPARALVQELKGKIKEAGGKGKQRAVITGCLDVCPKDAITIGVSRPTGHGDEFFTIDSHFESAADVILEHVKRVSQK